MMHLDNVPHVMRLLQISQWISLRPLRISAFSALNSNVNAEGAEVRRERRDQTRNGARRARNRTRKRVQL
jgi:hypothetical protein